MYTWGFPGGTSGKEPVCQYRCKKGQVQYLGWEDPLEKKIQPTPAFSPGEFLGQLAGYSP